MSKNEIKKKIKKKLDRGAYKLVAKNSGYSYGTVRNYFNLTWKGKLSDLAELAIEDAAAKIIIESEKKKKASVNNIKKALR